MTKLSLAIYVLGVLFACMVLIQQILQHWKLLQDIEDSKNAASEVSSAIPGSTSEKK